MKTQTIGRTLGIGLRTAGRMIGSKLSANAQAPACQPATKDINRDATRTAGHSAGRISGGVLRGLGGFLRPFRRVGGSLFLEVTGVFFFLPVLVYAPTFWRYRTSYAHGPGHRDFLLSAVIMAVFLYLSISSFWRARKR